MITKTVPALLCTPTGHYPTNRTTPELATALTSEALCDPEFPRPWSRASPTMLYPPVFPPCLVVRSIRTRNRDADAHAFGRPRSARASRAAGEGDASRREQRAEDARRREAQRQEVEIRPGSAVRRGWLPRLSEGPAEAR